jgi:hypothetical protein
MAAEPNSAAAFKRVSPVVPGILENRPPATELPPMGVSLVHPGYLKNPIKKDANAASF